MNFWVAMAIFAAGAAFLLRLSHILGEHMDAACDFEDSMNERLAVLEDHLHYHPDEEEILDVKGTEIT